MRDIAKYLHRHEKTICRLAARGQIPGFGLNASWRFKIDEIARWMEGKRRRTGVMEP